MQRQWIIGTALSESVPAGDASIRGTDKVMTSAEQKLTPLSCKGSIEERGDPGLLLDGGEGSIGKDLGKERERERELERARGRGNKQRKGGPAITCQRI